MTCATTHRLQTSPQENFMCRAIASLAGKCIAVFTLTLCCIVLDPCQARGEFELRDGDRVVLLGDTLIEREQHFGFIELMLTTRFPERNITFRNLGWSGDTPSGDSRCGLSLL